MKIRRLIVLVVVVVIGLIGWNQYQQSQERAASEQYEEAMALEKDGEFFHARDLYERVIRNYGQTEAATMAAQQLEGLTERERAYKEQQKADRLERLSGAAEAGAWLADAEAQDQDADLSDEEHARRQRDRLQEAVEAIRDELQ